MQEIRFATFNLLNLGPPGMKFYDGLEPYSPEEYEAKITWLAQQIDKLDADVIGFQEVFSQAALKDVLARSEKYKSAHHAGFDPDPQAASLTPNVALVSRLPLAAGAAAYADLPRGLSVPVSDAAEPMNKFTRPVLHAQVIVSADLVINVFVVHLKSKRPDYRNGDDSDDPYQLGAAVLRSLIRRGVEALGLRYLLTDYAQGRRVPLLVMGDFNDVAAAVSTQLVMGVGRGGKTEFDDRLFDSYRIQSRRDPLRNVGFSHMHDGLYETIDHVLVSEEFNPASPHARGEVLDVSYLNDHLAFRQPQASDHGAVLVRIGLYGTEEEPGGVTAPDDLVD
ncbi:MAG: endonuclease/exonuclease/phosphatase family protein [Pseudomonadota bacterium]